jgi:hypothetical protein
MGYPLCTEFAAMAAFSSSQHALENIIARAALLSPGIAVRAESI